MGTLTSTGIQIRRAPEVITDIEVSERENIDPNISTEDDEVLGQLNSIIGFEIASQEALAAAVYDAFNVDKAEGVSLDNLAALIGITRIAASSSFTESQQFTGTDGTTIPLGSLVENPSNGDRFTNTSSIGLNTLSCQSTKYSVQSLQDNTLYTITLNGVDATFTSDGTATELEILTGLQADIAGNSLFTGVLTATVDTPNLQLNIASDVSTTRIAVSSSSLIGPDEVTNFGMMEAVVTGAIIVPSNTVTSIVTAVSGWTSTTNPNSYTQGRAEETDEELRARIKTSQQISGVATVEAIRDVLANLAGVTSASVIENDTALFSGGSNVVTFTNGTDVVNLTAHTLVAGDAVRFGGEGVLPAEINEGQQYWVINPNVNDFQFSTTIGGSAVDFTDDGTGQLKVFVGRPPKSFESIVQGGVDLTIADAIWDSKPAGIETFGNVNNGSGIVITDSVGGSHTMHFSRPTEVVLNMTVDITQYDEESLPVDFDTAIKSAMVTFAATEQGVGDDVLPSRYYTPIFEASSGFFITQVQVTSPSVTTTQLVIEDDEFATLASGNITVNLT
jgi:uncharacterized phage protein gp47/JayE